MLTLYVTALPCLLLGVLIGVILASRLLWSSDGTGSKPEPEPLDEWTSAAIDQAAANWVRANDLPDEAAGLMADKLRLLHKLASERGWS